DARVAATAAVNAREAAAGHDDVRPADLDGTEGTDRGRTWREPCCCLRRPAERQRVEQFAVDHALLTDASHVDGRRGAAHRDRFGDRTNTQIRINRRRRGSDQLDAFATDRSKAGQGERDGVRARTERLDPVAAAAITDSDASAFDEHRTRGFHGGTGKHRPGRVSDHTGNRRLSVDGRGYQRSKQDNCGEQEALRQEDTSYVVEALPDTAGVAAMMGYRSRHVND